MKLNNSGSRIHPGGKRNEDREEREIRMKAFWTENQNATFYMIGRLLRTLVKGKTLAQRLVAGEEIELDSISWKGATLPLVRGFKLSLKSLDMWGCPACRSAHGSDVYPSHPSRGADAALLSKNKFYYNLTTKQLFTISDTCWSEYVAAIGANTPERFVNVPTAESSALPRRTG